MRRWWPVVALVLVAGGAALFGGAWWRGAEVSRPRPVPDGDREVAWLHTPTSGDTWEHFVWGLKRAEMSTSGAPGGLRVDDSAAFPASTTAVPEVIVARDGFAGKVRVRWYKVTNYAPTDEWVKSLAGRNPPPLVVIGGWSSDRARELAEAMAAVEWSGQKPLLFLSAATAETVEPENYASGSVPPGTRLITLYERSFRFCFTNRQMAESVADFTLTDPALRPGPAVLPGLRAVPGAAGGPWPVLPWLGGMLAAQPGVPAFAGGRADPPGLPAFAVTWKDDPYSRDLCEQFRDVFHKQGERPGRPRLLFDSIEIAFSAGRFERPNPYEAQVVDHILGNLPRRGERTVLVLPTVTAPARRLLGALAHGTPGAARRLVAVTGDGIPVNALFRDSEYAWPIRSIPIPLVLFTHANPFDWDEPGAHAPPPGYGLPPPGEPTDVKNSTEDIQLFTLVCSVLARGAFPDGTARIVSGADELANRFHNLTPAFFDPSGNRLAGSGEHVVVMRPTPRVEGVVTYPDATLEVWTRAAGGQWDRIHEQPVVQTVRPAGGGGGE